jgi:hypothetical protein
MQSVTTSTIINTLRKLFSANTSANSITKPAPTLTEPTGDGILDFSALGNAPGNLALLAFFGTRTSADNETFTARVTGWKKATGGLWIPFPLLALSLTQGASHGVAAGDVLAAEYFADTVTASTAFTSSNELISPADDTIALVKVDPCGAAKLQVQLAIGTNAACNCLAGTF